MYAIIQAIYVISTLGVVFRHPIVFTAILPLGAVRLFEYLGNKDKRSGERY